MAAPLAHSLRAADMDPFDDARALHTTSERSSCGSGSHNDSATSVTPPHIESAHSTSSMTTAAPNDTEVTTADKAVVSTTSLTARDAISANDDTSDTDAKKREMQLGRELFVFTAQKAGMSDIDKERVQQVVFDISKDSKFFQNSLKRNDKVDAKIAEMQRRLVALTDAKRELLLRRVDAAAAQLEASRDLSRTVVVVDMDMFYAAVEMRDDPRLRDVPLAVGGMNMICTTNYIARKFGVRAAMPGFIGKELCPSLVIVPTNFAKYTAVAAQIRAIFAEYDPHFSSCSLDEAQLDITEYMETHWRQYVHAVADRDDDSGEPRDRNSRHCRSNGKPSDDDDSDDDDDVSDELDERDRVRVAAAVVNEIRRKIQEQTELTASAGVAANSMLAKIASDMNKPNGQFVLPFTREAVVAFIQRQPVRKIGGIGKVMEKILAALGVATGADLFARRAELFHLFSDKTAPWLLRTSLAIQHVREARPRKSFSRERTFRSLSDPVELEAMCRKVCGYLADDMARANTGARTLTLKLKCADFSVRSRSVSFATTLRSQDDLFAGAVALLRKELPLTLRLLGVRASALVARADSANSASENKRQLGIDRFAVATASGGAHDIDVDGDGDGGASGSGDALTADESVDEADAAARLSVAGERARRRAARSGGAMARFVTALDKDATPDIVAAMLETSALGSARDGSGGAANDKALGAATAAVVSEGGSAPPPSSPPSSFQPCPICGKTINASNAIAISTHVDACIRKQQQPSFASSWRRRNESSSRSTKRARSDPHLLDAMECLQPCPICGDLINSSSSRLVNTHIDACILSSTLAPSDDVTSTSANATTVSSSSSSSDTVRAYPICGDLINASGAVTSNSHVDVCARSSEQQATARSGDEQGVLPRSSSPPLPSAHTLAKRRRRGGGAAQYSIRSFFATGE